MRAAFGDELPESVTFTELISKASYAAAARAVANPHTPALNKRRSETLKGRPKTPEHTAKQIAVRKRTGAYQRFMDGSRKYVASQRGSAISTLVGRLKGKDNGSPSKAVLREWAEGSSKRNGLPPEAILALWNEHMQRHGIATSAAGRKANEGRHRRIVAAMEKWPRSPSGSLFRGFWPKMAEDILGSSEPKYVLRLKDWYKHHCGYKNHPHHCAEPTLLERGNS